MDVIEHDRYKYIYLFHDGNWVDGKNLDKENKHGQTKTCIKVNSAKTSLSILSCDVFS